MKYAPHNNVINNESYAINEKNTKFMFQTNAHN